MRGQIINYMLFTLTLLISVASATMCVGLPWWAYIHFNGPLQGVMVTGAVIIPLICTICLACLTAKIGDNTFK